MWWQLYYRFQSDLSNYQSLFRKPTPDFVIIIANPPNSSLATHSCFRRRGALPKCSRLRAQNLSHMNLHTIRSNLLLHAFRVANPPFFFFRRIRPSFPKILKIFHLYLSCARFSSLHLTFVIIIFQAVFSKITLPVFYWPPPSCVRKEKTSSLWPLRRFFNVIRTQHCLKINIALLLSLPCTHILPHLIPSKHIRLRCNILPTFGTPCIRNSTL